MSGHSHWAKVKRAKSANDARRGKEWSKLARRIIVAAKSGGGKPEENLSLRYAIDDAKAANMPNDTIDKAIKKGTGELGAENYELVVYEGYGPGGVAFMVECLTNNRNRTAPEMRKIFERHNGQLGSTNCVAWMFQQKGTFVVAASAAGEDALMELAMEFGADDVTTEDDVFQITCPPAAFGKVKAALVGRNIPTVSAQIAMIPTSTIPLAGDAAASVLALMESLEEHEDVQNVYANFDIPAEVIDKLVK
ncbi:MAG: YebC/PmpR family DNA-binding transcriptional regulator [Phycisphaerae bacterium]|jgi:YebC/PmpR family DNA-binding regulatory protein